jgi:hypothetical protein
VRNLLATGDTDVSALLAQVSVPTLVMHARDDARFAYAFIGFETKGKSIEEIDRGLTAGRQQLRGRAPVQRAAGDRRA